MSMERREFLKVAGAAGLVGTAMGNAVAADEKKAGKELTVRQLESDRFVIDFTPAEPRMLRVLQLTDTHFGNLDAESKAEDKKSFAEITQMVKMHRPDFIVHTGDFINNDNSPLTSFEAIDFFDDLNIPWTHALGNHDIGFRPVPKFRKLMKNASVGEFKGPTKTEYAFRFDIVSSGASDPSFSIFCFDSGARSPGRRVNQPQIDWFNQQMTMDAEKGIKTPALAMIHIPVVEFEKLHAAKQYDGIFGEKVCFDDDKGDTFSAFKRSGRIMGVFSGHDHENDYHGQWEGIELVYGRVGGWAAYGDLPRGGRLIEINLKKQNYSHTLAFPDAKA